MRGSAVSSRATWAWRCVALTTAVALVAAWQGVSAGRAHAAASACDATPGQLVINCGFETGWSDAHYPPGWTVTQSTVIDPSLGYSGSNEGIDYDASKSANSGAHFFSFGATTGYD